MGQDSSSGREGGLNQSYREASMQESTDTVIPSLQLPRNSDIHRKVNAICQELEDNNQVEQGSYLQL